MADVALHSWILTLWILDSLIISNEVQHLDLPLWTLPGTLSTAFWISDLGYSAELFGGLSSPFLILDSGFLGH